MFHVSSPPVLSPPTPTRSFSALFNSAPSPATPKISTTCACTARGPSISPRTSSSKSAPHSAPSKAPTSGPRCRSSASPSSSSRSSPASSTESAHCSPCMAPACWLSVRIEDSRGIGSFSSRGPERARATGRGGGGSFGPVGMWLWCSRRSAVRPI
jgi:hypothetical protein